MRAGELSHLLALLGEHLDEALFEVADLRGRRLVRHADRLRMREAEQGYLAPQDHSGAGS